MAKKKTEVSLQIETNNQEEWELLLQTKGLIIIDVYQEWCGPCKATVGLFRRIKAELNDDLLHFAVAKSDNIEALERYRGRSEPYFLFFGGGCLVAAVKGVNPPKLEKYITEQLKIEHKVLDGEKQRIEIRDPLLIEFELAEAERKRKLEEEEEVPQDVVILIIQPDVVSKEKVEEITTFIDKNKIDIVNRKTHLFTIEEAKKFYSNQSEEPDFDNIIDFVTSGECEVLLCAKGNEEVFEHMHNLVGSFEDDVDIEKASITLRSQYGTDDIKNGVYVTTSKEDVDRELQFLFPDFERPIITRKRKQLLDKSKSVDPNEVEKTVALLRPLAYKLYKTEIIELIQNAGFEIVMQKEINLTKDKCEKYYEHYQENDYYDEIIRVMSNGTTLALVLSKEDAIATWREMLGPFDVDKAKQTAPNSLRAQFVVNQLEEIDSTKSDNQVEEQRKLSTKSKLETDTKVVRKSIASDKPLQTMINLIHGSLDIDEFLRDFNFFFPIERTICIIKPDAFANREEILDLIKATGFTVVASKEVNLSAELIAMIYQAHKDKPYFDDIINHLTSGLLVCAILSKANAVEDWHKWIGCSDPNKAAPDCLRAIYGRDIVKNALHGSSSIAEADRTIQLLFTEIDHIPDEMDVLDELEQDSLVKSNYRVVLEPEQAIEKDETQVDAKIEKELSNDFIKEPEIKASVSELLHAADEIEQVDQSLAGEIVSNSSQDYANQTVQKETKSNSITIEQNNALKTD